MDKIQSNLIKHTDTPDSKPKILFHFSLDFVIFRWFKHKHKHSHTYNIPPAAIAAIPQTTKNNDNNK